MKKWIMAVCAFSGLLLVGCSEKGMNLPEGFELVHSEANTHFVYVHENMRGNKFKSDHRRASTQLCDYVQQQSCEVYMWSNRELIPEGLPLRNDNSYIHAYFKRDEDGKKHYKCVECD